MPRTKVAKTTVLEATAPEPNGQPESTPEPQPRSVAEMPEVFKPELGEQIALDGFGKRYRDGEVQVQQQIQDVVQRLQPELRHLEGQLVGAVHFLLQQYKLEPNDYEIDVAPGTGRVTLRPKPPMPAEVPSPA